LKRLRGELYDLFIGFLRSAQAVPARSGDI